MSASPRVLGVDPGTISIDCWALEAGRTAGFRSLRTADVASDPDALLGVLDELGPFDLVAAPSGYGLPLVRGEELDERLLRLAFLAPPGVEGGILGLRRAVEGLRRSRQPLVFLPGVVHLPTVPGHRKVNRIDLGTADKVCAAALAVAEQARRLGAKPSQVSLILVEMGGAFTAALAVEGGAIVDGVGGTSGPPGFRAAGALDGEVAALAGKVPKDALFTGGVAWIAGDPELTPEAWEVRCAAGGGDEAGGRARTARLAYLEGVLKAVAALRTSAPSAREVVLSGRLARLPGLAADLAVLLGGLGTGLVVHGPAGSGKEYRPLLAAPAAGGELRPREGLVMEAALGAALLADGLCGGTHAALVEALCLREARGSVLDHLALPIAREGAARFEALLC